MHQESFEAGAVAYAAGLPCIEPSGMGRLSYTAAWRIGWKNAAAKAGDRDAFDRAMLLTEQRRAYGRI